MCNNRSTNMATKDPKKIFNEIVTDYLEKARSNSLSSRYRNFELEIGFGKRRPISRTDYENVIGQLIRSGWTCDHLDGTEMLRISSESLIQFHDNKQHQQQPVEGVQANNVQANNVQPSEDLPLVMPQSDNPENNPENNQDMSISSDSSYRTGGGAGNGDYACNADNGFKKERMIMASNVRFEIIGSELIENYCRYDSLDTLKEKDKNQQKIKFTKKSAVFQDPQLKTKFPKASFSDHGFGVAYKLERDFRIDSTDDQIRRIVQNWSTSKKTYRCMNRVRFYHPDIPLFVDLSVIKTNAKKSFQDKNNQNGKNQPPIIMPAYTFKSAGIHVNLPNYEIELEMDNTYFTRHAHSYTVSDIMTTIRKSIRTVMS